METDRSNLLVTKDLARMNNLARTHSAPNDKEMRKAKDDARNENLA